MTDAVRALVRLSAALATRDEERLKRRLAEAGTAAPHEAVEEALLQSYLFVGFPAALTALSLWRDLYPHDAQGGEQRRPGEVRARGEEICRRVYGNQYEALRRNVRRLHPDLEAWMLEEGYGKVLGRPGLSLPVRELCIGALLAVSGAGPQLRSHLRGALRTGASVEDVEEALREAASVAGPQEKARAREVWVVVLDRWRREGAPCS